MAQNSFLETLEPNSSQSEWHQVFDTENKKSSYKDFFSNLLGGRQDYFLNECWEKNPALIKAGQCNKKSNVLGDIFSKKKFLQILGSDAFSVATNFNAIRYVKRIRQERRFSSSEATAEELMKAFDEGYTVQFFQPQRFSDELYHINAGFEHTFGTLAGASAYLTPSGTQGLAPHHDDVDVFVIQLEGSKAWNLWPAVLPLPEDYSTDIPRDQLPKTTANVVLQPGDVLYMPRGTIHEAVAQSQFSTHITISLNQFYNVKKLVSLMVPRLLDAAFPKHVELRRGLPIRMSDKLGSFAGLQVGGACVSTTDVGSKNRETQAIAATDASMVATDLCGEKLTAWRNSFKTMMKSVVCMLQSEVTMDLIDEAADELTGDFVLHRLPPPDIAVNPGTEEDYEEERAQLDAAWEPTKVSASGDDFQLQLHPATVVRICDPRSMFCMVKIIDGVSLLAMANSRFNDRLRHMGHPSDEDGYESGADGGEDDSQGEEDGGSENEREEEEDGGEGASLNSGDEDGEDGESTSSVGEEGEGLPFSVFLPIRLAPVVKALQAAYADGGIVIRQLKKNMQAVHIFDDEVDDVIRQLQASGFIASLTVSDGMAPLAVKDSKKLSKKSRSDAEVSSSMTKRKAVEEVEPMAKATSAGKSKKLLRADEAAIQTKIKRKKLRQNS